MERGGLTPLKLLSVSLVHTYRCISDLWDLERIQQNGVMLNGRYIVQGLIGKGTFGIVIQGLDIKTSKIVAIKISRSGTLFRNQAEKEIVVLQSIKEHCVVGTDQIVRCSDYFLLNGHVCMVMERLALSVFDLIAATQFKGVSLNLTRKVIKQMLQVLVGLRSMSPSIIHGDIKPENIMFIEKESAAINLIDFGSACRLGEDALFKYIQSRFYRAPEVVLRIPYDNSIDIWSLGCVLVELHSGVPLFKCSNEYELIEKIYYLLGPPPADWVEKSPRKDELFCIDHNGNYQPKKLGTVSRFYRSIAEIFGIDTSQKESMFVGPPSIIYLRQPGHEPWHYLMFMNLIRSMLKWKASERISPAAGLSHNFLTDV